VYVPFGVPPPPPGLLLPPQAAWKTKPANSMQASVATASLPFLPFRSELSPTRVATNPISGRQSS
jgi:hypothetical protein